jgi:hypothetical protein
MIEGIEEYAKRTHRLSPQMILWVGRFLQKYSQPLKNAQSFSLSLQNQFRIHLFRGDIVRKGGIPFNRRGLYKFPISIEKAKAILARIPKKYQISINFDLELFLRALTWTRLCITPWNSLPSGRAISEEDRARGAEPNLITSTPCFMLLHLQFWAKSILNKPGYHCGNCFDLATPGGMALMLHEIFHIYQFRRNPFQMLWWYIRALRDSIVFDRILFSHPRIPFEVEAIAFEYQVREWLSTPEMQKALKIFAKLR